MDLRKLWEITLGEMEVQIPRASFATWLKNSRLVEKKPEGTLVVALPNSFTKEWVKNKYQKPLLGIIRRVDPSAKKLEFIVDNKSTALPTKRTKKQQQASQDSAVLEIQIDPETGLNPRYTMESFVVGGFNEFAHAAAEAIIKEVGVKYNPFFVYGGVGLGKTHLIQAIGNEIKKRYKGKIKPKYVSSEKFTSDVVWAIRNKRMEDMKRKYRSVDVLIIDDIQFIGGKEKTEEEFFHTFNALYELNKQIIISSDRPPQAIPTLEERLRSRFEGGLIADIGYPDFETRMAIIKKKLHERGRELPEPIIATIARKVKKNIREIEGVVNKILFYQDRKDREITEREVNDIIEKSIVSLAGRITDTQIIETVAKFYRVNMQDIIGRCRKKEVLEPRQVAVYLLRDILGLSYPYIGEKLGRDHTTAIHAYEKINHEINKNSTLNQKIIMIRDMLSKADPQ